MSTVVVSPDPLSLAQSTYSGMRTSENIGQDLDDPEPAYGDIQMEYSSY
jgi:hypothetical protein